MAITVNNVANITTAKGDNAGDCLVMNYDASRTGLSATLRAITLDAGTPTLAALIGKLGNAYAGLNNVGHISIDGEPTASTPGTDDQTVTTVLHDDIEFKTGRIIITSRTFTFTLVETIRGSAWMFVNGGDAITSPAANTGLPAVWRDTGNNAIPQTILIPNELVDRFEVTVIEKGQVILSEDFTDSANKPRVLGVSIDCQEGVSFNAKIVRLVWMKNNLHA